jgi:hypothetical protein
MKRLSLIACIAMSACTQPNHATHVLHQAGYKNVQITGYNWLACSEDDTYHTGFTATGPTGMAVSGTVCAGMFFNGSTIRLD